MGKDFKVYARLGDRRARILGMPRPLPGLKGIAMKQNKSIEGSLGQVVGWYVENPKWWKKIKQKKEFLDHYRKQSLAKYY